MKKLFPPMMNNLHILKVFHIFPYWVVVFVVIPLFIPLLADGLWDTLSVTSWIECIYYAINGICIFLFLKEHLVDSFFDVRLVPKTYLLHTGLAVMLMFIAALLGSFALPFFGLHPLLTLDVFPISEMGVTMTPGLLVSQSPIVGTVCLSVFVPVTVCGLFYATGFSPLGDKAPWAGYLNVAFLLVLPILFDILWRQETLLNWMTYALRLPVHLIACWSYQKTDNIWTPIFSLSAFNLLMSVLNIVLSNVL